MKTHLVFLLTATLLAAANAHAFDCSNFKAKFTSREKTQCMMFYSKCEPMSLVLMSDLPERTRDGLSQFTVRNAIESRLRAARIYNRKGRTALVVHVLSERDAYFVQVVYVKRFMDVNFLPAYDVMAGLWGRPSIGFYDKNPRLVVSVVSQLVDEFLANFLRANQKDCGER